MTFNMILVVALVCTFTVSAVNHFSAQRRDRELLQIVKCLDAMLRAWADTFGDDTREVKVKLHKVMQDCLVERRQAERRRLWH